MALDFPKMKKLTHAIHEAMNVGIEVVDMLIERMVEIVNRHTRSRNRSPHRQRRCGGCMKVEKSGPATVKIAPATSDHGLNALLLADHAVPLELIVG